MIEETLRNTFQKQTKTTKGLCYCFSLHITFSKHTSICLCLSLIQICNRASVFYDLFFYNSRWKMMSFTSISIVRIFQLIFVLSFRQRRKKNLNKNKKKQNKFMYKVYIVIKNYKRQVLYDILWYSVQFTTKRHYRMTNS